MIYFFMDRKKRISYCLKTYMSIALYFFLTYIVLDHFKICSKNSIVLLCIAIYETLNSLQVWAITGKMKIM